MSKPLAILIVLAVIAAGVFLGLRNNPPNIVPKAVTFADDVAPIIHAKCAVCHHPGEGAPFALLTYDDVRHRGRQIVDVTQSGFMPPWLPQDRHFANTRGLSDLEKTQLKEWVDSGMPAGDAPVTAPTFPDGWRHGPPDLILESPAYTLTESGPDVFRNFVVNVPLDSQRWITSVELRAVNPKVTHHARLGVDASGESRRRDAEDGQPGYAGMAWGQDPEGDLVIWAPGMTAPPPVPGAAWRLNPQAKLVLHAHLQPSGKRETVRFRIGLRFGAAPTTPTLMLRVGPTAIDIPAGADSHEIRDTFTLPVDVDVLTIFPHAHSLCKSMNVSANGVPIITIPKFDENWHDVYHFKAPLRLPAGSVISTTFKYDNTAANPRNRSTPPRRTVYGSGVADEMGDVYLRIAPVRPEQRAVLLEEYGKYDAAAHTAGFRMALDAAPGNVWHQEGLAASRVAAGDFAEAKSILENRVQTGPPDIFPQVSLALVNLAKGDAATAEALARTAMAKDADYPLAWLALGKSLVQLKKPAEAEPALRRAVALAPGATDAALLLTDVLLNSGDLAGASTVCNEALKASPDAPNLHLKMADIHVRGKDHAAALACCAAAQRLAPALHPPKVLLAVLCANHGDAARGVQLLQGAIAETPRHPMAYLLLGQMASRQQQLDVAKTLFKQAQQLPLPDTWPASHRQRFQVLLNSEMQKLPK